MMLTQPRRLKSTSPLERISSKVRNSRVLAAAANLRTEEAGKIAAEIHDLPGVGLEDQRLAWCPGLVDGTVGGVRDGLQFEGWDRLQFLFRVTAELRADRGEGTVLPGGIRLDTRLDLALGNEPGRLPDDVIGIINAARQQRLHGLCRDLGLVKCRSGVARHRSQPGARRYTSENGR